MPRKTFSDILNTTKVNIGAEYRSAWSLFYEQHDVISLYYSLYEFIDENFTQLPLHDTCFSLEEFDEKHGFDFADREYSSSLDDLLSLLEYVLNIINNASRILNENRDINDTAINFVASHIKKICDKIDHTFIEKGDYFILVQSNPAALEAAQSLTEENASLPFEYSHHSLQGNINGKREILLSMAHELEPKRESLKKIDATLESDLFFLINNMNIRHNNIDKSSKNYKTYVANMTEEEIETWYDRIYNLMMIALIKLGDSPTAQQISTLKEMISSKGNNNE